MSLLCVTDASGQLGNRLFTFAHVIAAALEHGHTVANPAFAPYAETFVGTAGDLLCRYPPRRSRLRPSADRGDRVVRWLSVALPFAEALARSAVLRRSVAVLESGATTTLLDPGGECDLDGPGFRQAAAARRLVLLKGPLHRAHRSIRKHGDAVRKHFRPVDRVARAAGEAMARARRRGRTVVGVHVRHRDYRSFLGGRYFFAAEQYAALMGRLAAVLGAADTAFLVCSDEPQEPGAFGELRVERAGGSAAADLFALARCDYVVGPPSTFSAFASFLGAVPRYTIEDVGRPPRLADFVVCRN